MKQTAARTGFTGPGDVLSQVRSLPLLILLFLLGNTILASGPAQADPRYEGLLLYSLDPVISTTKDPRLLGVDRLVLRERLLARGIDPVRDHGRRPNLYDQTRHLWFTKSGYDPLRMEEVLEYNGTFGTMTVFQYPDEDFFFFFPAEETLPGGLTYYPPRPVGDPLVRVFVDEAAGGARRRHRVGQVLVKDAALDVAGAGRSGSSSDGLLNFTIPIKLPRTLEKIIGRGEKTKIKISGRERIAISGESTVIDPFVPTERVTSQSLFPTLDMEQELQVNLSGTIGEKIIIEVDHNSAAIGPEGTKIKLMYQGLEDEIIKTIETGDVGLTLPGSQLLGYSSNKSGLFGIKVTGQIGRADFTVVASKQKAESSAKTFNSKGGTPEDKTIYSYQYLNNRFFKLDLPPGDYVGNPEVTPDFPGREVFDFDSDRLKPMRIDPTSVKIYRFMGQANFADGDIENVAVFLDDTGTFWQHLGAQEPDWNSPFEYGRIWRPVEFEYLTDTDGTDLIAVDVRQQLAAEEVLGVIYNVVRDTLIDELNDTWETKVVYRVGDRPNVDDRVPLEGQDGLFYRMKLLKAAASDSEHHSFQYVLRNIYSLGGTNIDPTTFELRIERIKPGDPHPELDTNNNIPYIQIFGLDRTDERNAGLPDGKVDFTNSTLFDLDNGLVKFPTFAFPTPFAGSREQYEEYADTPDDTTSFVWEDSFLSQEGTLTPDIYNPDVLPSEYPQYGKFRLVATHASASSSFSLGVSNIEEGSETVTLDGTVLQRGVDYDIDYTFGQIELKGDRGTNLSAESKISVTYSYAPFFGGGTSSLMGLNVGYDLGRSSSLSTTLLYQTEDIVGEKAKLGEEPSKTLVTNINFNHTFKPYFLTHVANFLSRVDSERESSLQLTGELAVSLPNPNTKGKVYLEDFEGVDASDIITLSRTGWSWASQPYLGEQYLIDNPDNRVFLPEKRVNNVRWFLPKNRTERRMLNPDLINQERAETQQVMDMYLRNDEGWQPDSWGGIMRGVSRTGMDLSKAQFLEIWVNDARPDSSDRRGRLHIDFGSINEDGFWKENEDGSLEVGNFDQEDGILDDGRWDNVWTYQEDVGLDGKGENGPQRYSAEYDPGGDAPFPFINGTARNNREDTEDINGNTKLDTDDGYYTVSIDLRETEPLVDVVYDYDDVADLVSQNISWRKYRIRLGEVDESNITSTANIKAVKHVRIWYEDDELNAPDAVHLQFSEFKFLGSRWEREGVRRTAGEVLLDENERLPGEEFFLGEVNNKENPDYHPPFNVHEVNNIPEKEQAMVLDFRNLDVGHMVRASKQVSPRGDDYTNYDQISWYLYNPNHQTADVDLFFRVGADTLNYYEVGYRFSEGSYKTGWKYMNVDLAELSNVKNNEADENGIVHGTINDASSGDPYRVRVVGRPDLRQVRRYYLVVANNDLSTDVSGYIYLNDVKLEGVKREIGMAQRIGMRLNMADVLKMDLDWSRNDAEFHGLDSRVGSGINEEDWTFSTNFNLEDFVPLAGFKIPINASRRQTTQRPKYQTNSDIEILDEDTRNLMSTISTTERFQTSLRHSPSQSVIPRYLVDPWSLQLNGSQTSLDGPTQESFKKNLAGSLNYDLRIVGDHRLNGLPLVKYVPVLKGLTLVPKRVAFGASFSSLYTAAATIDEDGVSTPRPTQISRPGKLTTSVDYSPLRMVSAVATATSDRDLLREERKYGVNIGQENKRTYDLSLVFTLPMAKELPTGKLFYPLRFVAREMNKMRPSIKFSGGFTDDHSPTVRLATDPVGVRNLGNGNNWEFRLNVPLGDAINSLLPPKRYSAAERRRMIDSQKRRDNQDRRQGRGGTDVGTLPDYTGLTPEEIQQREEERLLREAEQRLEEDRERGLGAEEEKVDDGEPGFSLLSLYNAGLDPLRNITPVKMTYTNQRQSAFAKMEVAPQFWYLTGLSTDPAVADSLYRSYRFTEKERVDISTTTKMSKNLTLDVKFGNSLTFRDELGSVRKNFQQDWPDASINLTGIEKWGVFGGTKDPNSGWFRSGNLNLSYKHSKTVNNMTSTAYDPQYYTTVSPRLTINFHSGLTATVNANLTTDEKMNSGTLSTTKRQRYGLQLKHQFRAQKLLAGIGLYRPGSNPIINMDLDISYDSNRTERVSPGGIPTTPTGIKKWAANPRFTYQVSRNLSGSLRFIFSYDKNLTTNQSTTTMGLGLEAIFTF